MPRDPAKPWRIGHTFRVIPDGYFESIQTGENRLTDPMLAARFERLRRITRGPLLSWQRFWDIVQENLGIPATPAPAGR
jgi:arabinofuranosyltransferase